MSEQVETTQSVYDMPLHSSASIEEHTFIKRVPGGWIYTIRTPSNEQIAWHSVFVPYTNMDDFK